MLPVTDAAESRKEGEDDGGGQTVNVRFVREAEKFFEVDTSDPETQGGKVRTRRLRTNRESPPTVTVGRGTE